MGDLLVLLLRIPRWLFTQGLRSRRGPPQGEGRPSSAASLTSPGSGIRLPRSCFTIPESGIGFPSGSLVAKKDNESNVEFEASSHNIRSKRINVRGEVDVNSAPVLLQQILTAIERRPEVIIINLAQVTKMDSAGVAVLIESINVARKEKIILSLQDLSKPAQQVLEMARVDKLFQVSGKNYLPPQQ